MLVKNIGPRAWYWPFTESGEPDRVEPGELYELDVSSPRRQPGESIEEYRKRRDDVIEHGSPRVRLFCQLRDAGMLGPGEPPPPPETMH